MLNLSKEVILMRNSYYNQINDKLFVTTTGEVRLIFKEFAP